MDGITVYPLTPDRWDDFADLFGERGACGGCWCTFFKLPHKEYHLLAGEQARELQRQWVEGGLVPGLLAYDGDLAVGWIGLEPREAYPRLERSRVSRRVDGQPVWSVVCFFTRKSHRGRGVSVALLRAGLEHARKMGGKIVEGYPVEVNSGKAPDPFVFPGLPGAFRAVGFTEVARYSPTRPIFRYYLEAKDDPA